MKSRKAQLTFFILIGIIIMVIMGFVFYVSKQVTEHRTKKETLESQETSLDITAVRNYVTACLEKTAKDGMNLLGKQGGMIYEVQGGMPNQPTPDTFISLTEAGGDEINVTYGLVRVSFEHYNCTCPTLNIQCNNSISEELHDGSFEGLAYPWEGFPSPLDRRCIGDGCFGHEFLPGIDGPDSMYSQLEIYINNSFETCLDNFSTFVEQGFDIQSNGTLDINVTTTEETVVALLNYPINVIDSSTKKQTRLTSFYYDTKIRLKKLHQLAVMLVNEDKNNESYDIRDYGFSDPYIEIGIIRHNLPSIDISISQDNIVRITDTFSSVPFVFQFGRENRPPALEYISPQSVSEDNPFNDSYFDFINGYDPDESDITMYYSSDELGLNYNTNFSKDLSNLCGFPSFGEFTVKVCVSDDHYKPYSCIPGGDISRDWQEVNFNIYDC